MSMEITGILREGNSTELVRTGRSAKQESSSQGEETKSENPDIDNAVRELQIISKAFNRRLQFTINRDLDQVVVKVIDAETDKLIRELPSRELQRLHVRIREAIGLLIDETI